MREAVLAQFFGFQLLSWQGGKGYDAMMFGHSSCDRSGKKHDLCKPKISAQTWKKSSTKQPRKIFVKQNIMLNIALSSLEKNPTLPKRRRPRTIVCPTRFDRCGCDPNNHDNLTVEGGRMIYPSAHLRIILVSPKKYEDQGTNLPLTVRERNPPCTRNPSSHPGSSCRGTTSTVWMWFLDRRNHKNNENNGLNSLSRNREKSVRGHRNRAGGRTSRTQLITVFCFRVYENEYCIFSTRQLYIFGCIFSTSRLHRRQRR